MMLGSARLTARALTCSFHLELPIITSMGSGHSWYLQRSLSQTAKVKYSGGDTISTGALLAAPKGRTPSLDPLNEQRTGLLTKLDEWSEACKHRSDDSIEVVGTFTLHINTQCRLQLVLTQL